MTKFYSPWFSIAPYPEIRLTDLLAPSAEHYRDKPALINYEGTEYTFGHAWAAARKLGRFLADNGLQQGDRVAIFAANCPEYFVAFYGTLFAGGTVTTLNPLYKDREVLHQLEDSGVAVVFAMGPLVPMVEGVKEHLPGLKHIFPIENVWTLAGEAEDAPPDLKIDVHEDLVALPYSSGTTGLPKGVMLTHYNVVSNVRQTLTTGLSSGYGVYLDFLPFYHIYGMVVLMACGFAAGIPQVIMPRFDPALCLDLVQKHKVTNLFAVPPALLALAHFPDTDKYDTSTLTMIMSGAAPLPPEVARAAGKALDTTVLQGYGMTETSPVTNVNPITRIKDATVGPPIADTIEKVVSLEDGAELGPGGVGELRVFGPQVMKGYWNNADATAETLPEPGWINTGDIVSVDDDGYVTILDRKKEMIKYKGYQIAPAELEALLMEHPKVRDSAVIPKRDAESGEVPKAFVLVAEGQELTADELMSFVEERVAPYKKVREIEFVDAIPKTPSGKILRRELIEQERAKMADTS
ncbi:MAG TPA: AMP-binding protein [Dehalococcoidia bacterium]|nr:AMP-binding protein [Dehalococcoidia bacterium]